ncbi:MAG: zinc carboxypeptidase [Leadbetterella sp.]|nr:zinc carboxypeptidase [Leadbetterella sp.]
MYRIIPLLLFVCFVASGQKLQSPEEYFGYGFGEKFHFHSQVAEYARYVTRTNAANTRLLPYGRTSEGRDLLVVAFGSAENINRLEDIRKANLQQIGLLQGSAGGAIPAIAMLSYNIHGNEAVNTEVALQMLYELGRPDSEFAQKVFKNAIVLIDPCANPDGYDRYSQWYNRHISKQPDANPDAMEHKEPWPGGRFNHYHFDMNRDLAWQTQLETQQRIRFYNSWMPHFHGDFHEMGPNSPYFFAPSAKPFHEDFTPFQREFQNRIGDYHKKEFDQNGWLYYTKQNYDLLYPSYGDTYPSYNGAIAMTYEQGGSGVAGLAYARSGGDTLTLKDRMLHTRSTSKAALEAVSDHATAIKDAFAQYFKEPAQKGYGPYKSFVMKGREGDIKALAQLLDRLEIRYSYGSGKKGLNGFRYKTQKKDNFTLETNDLIVNTYQPKGVMTKILFEPHTMLEDSNTYDITAWALPYAYGLEAYGLEQKVEGGAFTPAEAAAPVTASGPTYAYALKLGSFDDYRFLAAALRSGVKVRVQPEAFQANKKEFPAGTVIFVRDGDKTFEDKIRQVQKGTPATLEPLYTGMMEKGLDLGLDGVRPVGAPRVGILMGVGLSPTGFGDVWHFFDQQIGYPATLLDNKTLGSINLSAYDVLVFPGGRYDKAVTESQALKDWVNRGGRMILIEDACAAFAGVDGYELKEKQQPDKKADLTRKYGEASRSAISGTIPGAIYEVKLDNTHPLAYGYGDTMNLLIKETNEFENLVNGWNVGVLGDYKSGFVGSSAKKKMKDVTVFGVQNKGRGKVIYLTESPIFRGFWHSGKALFANAVFFVK